MTRAVRQEAIRRIIAERAVQNQQAVQAALSKLGIAATQGTISRDLRAIGAVKGPGGYLVNDGGSGVPAAQPEAVLAQHVMSVERAVGLVVLKTRPGSAQVVALELDRHPPAAVVGTVAGDDTVLVACASAPAVKSVANRLRGLAGLRQRDGSAA
jgi:transcriptional regulator of arginine metabolism